jgi:hypothetical protein
MKIAECKIEYREARRSDGGLAHRIMTLMPPASRPVEGHLGLRRPKRSEDGAFETETRPQVESGSVAKESGVNAAAAQNGRRSERAESGRIAPQSGICRHIAPYRGLRRREKNEMISKLPKMPGVAVPGLEFRREFVFEKAREAVLSVPWYCCADVM